MTIYLVQHGKCLDKTVDSERSLSAEGRAETIQMANSALDVGIRLNTIYHSGKLRAQQTADIFSEHLNVKQVERLSAIDPLDNVIDFVKNFKFLDSTMIVGHLPFMQRVAAYLMTGNEELFIVKFQNSGIICLDENEKNHWHLKWTILPIVD